MKLSLAELTGGAGMILQSLSEDHTFRFTPKLNPVVAWTLARGIAQELAENAAIGLIKEPITEAYSMYVMTNGEYETLPDRATRDDWLSGLDDMVEAVLLPYEKLASADWFGRHVIDSRIWQKHPNQPDDFEIGNLCDSFAEQVWKGLTFVFDTDEDGDRTVRELTTDEILAACGVTRGDVDALLKARPAPTAQDVQQAKAQTMAEFNDVVNRIGEYIEMSGMDEKTAVALLENAINDDDGIAASISAFGGMTLDDCEPLRLFAMEHNDDAADELYAIIKAGPYETGDLPGAGELIPETASGSIPLVALRGASAGPPLPLPPPPGMGAPPAPAKRGGRTKGPVVGALPAAVFELIRTHVNVKDEDVGALLGVSRQTFINYAKGKAQFVPSADQQDALIALLEKHRDGIELALTHLGVTSGN